MKICKENKKTLQNLKKKINETNNNIGNLNNKLIKRKKKNNNKSINP